jgi:hypothetical protein
VSALVTNLSPGTTYYFRAMASNSVGSASGTILTLATDALAPSSSPFEQWQSTNFGANATNSAIAGDTADPDGDGVANLLEYAFGLNPLVRDAEGLPDVVPGAGLLSLDYVQMNAATDITYRVQWATNLLSWFTNGVSEQTLSTNATSRTLRATVGTTNDPQKFLRVRVSRP